MHVPGRSQKERSVRSGPLSSRQTQFFEKLSSCLVSGSPSGPDRKVSWLTLGFKMARWARRIRSSTCFLSVMVEPKGMFSAWPIGCPRLSTVFLNTTLHDQGRSEYDSRHSVGHLHLHSKNRNGRKSSTRLPRAGTSRSRESDSRYRLNQGRLPCALRTNNGDHW